MDKILFLLFSLIIILKAEPYDIKIRYPFESELFDVTEDYNSDIAIVGFSKSFATQSNKSSSFSNAFRYLSSQKDTEGEQIHMLKLSSHSGETTYDNRLALEPFNQAVSLIKSRRHSYFIGGYTQKGKLLLLKLSDKKRIKKFKEFGTRNYDKMSKLLSLRDGGVLAIATSMTSRNLKDPMFEQGLGLNDIYLTRFSANGKIAWSKKFGSEFDDRGVSATEADDGTLVIVGTKDEKRERSVTIIRLSEKGDTIWREDYKKGKISDVKEIITLRDNTFLVALTLYNKEMKKFIRFMKFDIQYNILSEKDITSKHNQEIFSIKEGIDGSIIAVGSVTNRKKANTNALAIYFNPMLQLIWKNEFGQSSYDIFRSVTILKDSTFVAVGTTTPNYSEKNDMWIVKLNHDGTIADKKSEISASLYEMLSLSFAKEIKNSEITIMQDLSITLESPLLEFKTGEYKLSQKQIGFLKNFTPKFLKVLKMFKSDIKYISMNGHTSSIWKDVNEETQYLSNMELSTKRSYETLQALYKCTSKSDRVWLKELLEAHSFAFKHKIMNNKQEDIAKSQRVTLKVELH